MPTQTLPTPNPSGQNRASAGSVSTRFNDPKAAACPLPPRRKPPLRVSSYTAEEGLRICERIATTPQSLTRLCQAPDMPGVATITRWLRQFPEFRDSYGYAKQMQVELIFDRMFAIADDTSQDLIVAADGRTVPNPAAIRCSQVRLEACQKEASKLLPRKYRQKFASDQ